LRCCSPLAEVNPEGQHPQPLRLHRLMAILAGAKPEKDTVLPSPLITIENACQYYNPDSLF
jgi:hypothetical protein